MTNGFSIDPQVLAQLAAASFRPPQPPTLPGFNLQPPLPQPRPETPGFNVGNAIFALANGLAGWKPDSTIVNAGPQGSGPGGAYTTADAMGMAGLNRDPMDPSYGVPPPVAASGGNPLAWIRRQLGLRAVPSGGLL